MKSVMYLRVLQKQRHCFAFTQKQLNVIFDRYIATHTHTANSGFSSYESLRSAIPPTNMEMFTNKKSYIYSLMLNEEITQHSSDS